MQVAHLLPVLRTALRAVSYRTAGLMTVQRGALCGNVTAFLLSLYIDACGCGLAFCLVHRDGGMAAPAACRSRWRISTFHYLPVPSLLLSSCVGTRGMQQEPLFRYATWQDGNAIWPSQVL